MTTQPLRDIFDRDIVPVGAIEMLVPQRTLFVSPQWPLGADPSVFFTDPQAAIAQAEGPLAVSDASTVNIYFFRGPYSLDHLLVTKGGIVLSTVDQAPQDNDSSAFGAGQVNPTVAITTTSAVLPSINFLPTGAGDETLRIVGIGFVPGAAGPQGRVACDFRGKTGGRGIISFSGTCKDYQFRGRHLGAGADRDVFYFSGICASGIGGNSFSNDMAFCFWTSATIQTGLSVNSFAGPTIRAVAKGLWCTAGLNLAAPNAPASTWISRSSSLPQPNVIGGWDIDGRDSSFSPPGPWPTAVPPNVTCQIDTYLENDENGGLSLVTTGGGAADVYTFTNKQPDTLYTVILTPINSAVSRTYTIVSQTQDGFTVKDFGVGAGTWAVTVLRTG